VVADLEVEAVYAGGGYIAAGTWRPLARRPPELSSGDQPLGEGR
jgi:hypothetical protein